MPYLSRIRLGSIDLMADRALFCTRSRNGGGILPFAFLAPGGRFRVVDFVLTLGRSEPLKMEEPSVS
jgi:hypothetical protein